MDDTRYIRTGPPPHPAMDYDQLRQEGIAHLQQLAGDNWTDYNPHDPGVTILEMLCFALAEVGYRTEHDLPDILAEVLRPEEGPVISPYFTAQTVLPSAPLTIADYRKLLIDLPFLRNAWLEKTTHGELTFYHDQQNQVLTYKGALDFARVPIQGLYEVLVEFEPDAEQGDLNRNLWTLTLDSITWQPEEASSPQTITPIVEFAFPFWDQAPSPLYQSLDGLIKGVSLEKSPEGEVVREFKDNQINDYFARILLNLKDGTTLGPLEVRIKQTGQLQPTAPAFQTALKDQIAKHLRRWGKDSMLRAYNHKLVKVHQHVQRVWETLHTNRNVGEDFVAVKALRIQEIGLHLDLELVPGQNPVPILGQIFLSLETFLAEPLHFHDLQSQLDALSYPDEVFEGPSLAHGFVRTADLNQSDNWKILYVSDFVRRVMSIPKVAAVMDLKISNYVNNKVLNYGVRNCLRLAQPTQYKPRLSVEKSFLRVRSGDQITWISLENQQQAIYEAWQGAKQQEDHPKPEELPTADTLDLPIPMGQPMDLAQYDSLQSYFPDNYGIGPAGLPPNATAGRHAQAKQLKGYLLVFEQILTNHLAQLSHTKRLLSLNLGQQATYFSQSLAGTPGLEGLLTENYEDQFPALSEGLEEGFDRRNRLLDHLLARFGEDLSGLESVLLDNALDEAEYLDFKAKMIQNLPQISRNRGQGINLQHPQVWDTAAISGIEQRLAARMGLMHYQRRSLLEQPLNFHIQADPWVDTDYRVYLYADGQTEGWWLRSRRTDTEAEAEQLLRQIEARMGQAKHWEPHLTEAQQHSYNLMDEAGDYLARVAFRDTAEEATQLKNQVLQRHAQRLHEGFHLIEHLLLRPKWRRSETELDALLPVVFTQDENLEPLAVYPHDLQITLLFPCDTGRFRDPDFRRYVEKLLEEEIPAHLWYHTYWLTQKELAPLDQAYRTWLSLQPQLISSPTLATQRKAIAAQKALVKALTTLQAQHD